MKPSHRITLIIITIILMLTTLIPTIAKAHPNTLPADPNFKGIYEFSSHNSSTDATNPAIAGTYLGYYWSQLEPLTGTVQLGSHRSADAALDR